MPCPVCNERIGEADHRFCVLDLLKSGTIKTADQWTKMATDKPETIRKGKVKAMLPKE